MMEETLCETKIFMVMELSIIIIITELIPNFHKSVLTKIPNFINGGNSHWEYAGDKIPPRSLIVQY